MILSLTDALNIGIEDLFVGAGSQKQPRKSPLEKARHECRVWIDRASSKEALRQMARVLRAMSGEK